MFLEHLKKNEKLFFCHQWILDRCDLGTPSNLYWHAVSETEAGSISYFETCTAMYDIKMARCWGISIRNFSTSEQGSRHVEIYLSRTSCGFCQCCQTWYGNSKINILFRITFYFSNIGNSLQDVAKSESLNENVIEVEGLDESLERTGIQKISHINHKK